MITNIIVGLVVAHLLVCLADFYCWIKEKLCGKAKDLP